MQSLSCHASIIKKQLINAISPIVYCNARLSECHQRLSNLECALPQLALFLAAERTWKSLQNAVAPNKTRKCNGHILDAYDFGRRRADCHNRALVALHDVNDAAKGASNSVIRRAFFR
jgi:hypothetical protein